MIQGISGQLPERFKLKIGQKGEARKGKGGNYRLPTKWDHMKICSLERDANDDFIVDEEITKELGDGSLEPKLIGPIVLLYNDPDVNLWTMYRAYKSRTCMCKGDGETARRFDPSKKDYVETQCPCDNLKKKICKPNGILSFVIPSAELGGVCKFRTTSWNSIRSLLGGMAYFRQLTGGVLRGVPLYIRMNEKSVDVEGKTQKVYFLSLEYKGNLEDVRQHALEYAKADAQQLVLVENIEAAARKRHAIEAEIVEQDDEDKIEFYPEVREKEDGAIVDNETGDLIQAPPAETRTATFPMKQAKAPEPTEEPAPEEEVVEEEAEPEPEPEGPLFDGDGPEEVEEEGMLI